MLDGPTCVQIGAVRNPNARQNAAGRQADSVRIRNVVDSQSGRISAVLLSAVLRDPSPMLVHGHQNSAKIAGNRDPQERTRRPLNERPCHCSVAAAR